jgi:hypothetical protein
MPLQLQAAALDLIRFRGFQNLWSVQTQSDAMRLIKEANVAQVKKRADEMLNLLQRESALAKI